MKCAVSGFFLWTEWEFNVIFSLNSDWPRHWRRGPAALYPGKQSQRYDPSVFTHALCGPHMWGLSHSSMSGGKTNRKGWLWWCRTIKAVPVLMCLSLASQKLGLVCHAKHQTSYLLPCSLLIVSIKVFARI